MTAAPLCNYPNGSEVRITTLASGGGARCRLCSLGLTPGTLVKVVKNGPGPCRISVRGSELILGHCLAHKVLALPAQTG